MLREGNDKPTLYQAFLLNRFFDYEVIQVNCRNTEEQKRLQKIIMPFIYKNNIVV